MDRDRVIYHYIEHVLDHGQPPPSVHAFAKALEVGDREFYENFPSFDALEAAIWEKLVRETVSAIRSGPEWDGFSAQQKMLTFHYAFCEKILDHRSFFLLRFPKPRQSLIPDPLKRMQAAFVEFAEELIQQGKEEGEIACRGMLERGYPQALFGHFLTVVAFNLKDDSEGFQRTDAYIEKSVRLAFDVLGTQALDSAFDLLRFFTGRSQNRPEGSEA